VVGTTCIVFRQSQTGVAEYKATQAEADFRYGLVSTIRNNAESSRFYRGEHRKASEAGRRLNGLIVNYDADHLGQRLIQVIQRFLRLLPPLFAWRGEIAPIYFAREV